MPTVEIYSTPTCPYCTIAKKYFDDNDVSYIEYDVSMDTKKADEMQKKSGQMGVPVIIIKEGKNETILTGFDKEKIDKTLRL